MINTEYGEGDVPYATFSFDEEPGFAQPPVFGTVENPVEPIRSAPIDYTPDYGDLSPRSAALASLAPRLPTLPEFVTLPEYEYLQSGYLTGVPHSVMPAHIFEGATGGHGSSNVSGPHAEFLDAFQSVEVQLLERRTNPDSDLAPATPPVVQTSSLESGSAAEEFISVFGQVNQSLEELRQSEAEQRRMRQGLPSKGKGRGRARSRHDESSSSNLEQLPNILLQAHTLAASIVLEPFPTLCYGFCSSNFHWG